MLRIDRRRELVLGALLGLAVLGAYGRVCRHTFVDYDDPEYVTANPKVAAGWTAAGLRWALTTGHASNWFPLTWFSHMTDVALFGLDPGRHHATSLALHLVNTLLLMAALRRMTGDLGRSALVAGLFALHPLHVESVAWLAERKDVLSGTFMMLALGAYARYAERPGIARHGMVTLLLALGLMAKPMLVTLPLVLLLIDHWPLGRLALPGGTVRAAIVRPAPERPPRPLGALLLEKVPWLVLSVASSAVTFLVQRSAGAVSPLDELPLGTRVANALVAGTAYLGKTLWPAGLSVFYPLDTGLQAPVVVGSGLALAAISTVAVLEARRRPALLVGWSWYLGMLVPVIGLVQVGSQAMADRYTYLPLVGIFVALAWVLPDPVFLAGGRWRLARAALTGVLLVLGFLTWRQAGVWRDTRTLFEHALRIDPANYLARGCLAGVDARAGKTEPAIAGYREALRLNPRFSLALNGLGAALQAAGRLDEAVAHYRQAVRIRPDNADLHNNLAWILATSRRADLRSGPEAVELAGRACTLTGHANPEMLDTLAAAQAEAGSFEAAVRTAERAIALARAAGLEGAAARFAKRLASYRAGRPTREGE